MITNYTQATEYLGRKSDRPLPGQATRLQRRTDDAIAVHYQATDVITYYADGRIVLNSGGWQTSTTKARILEYTRGLRLWQAAGLWYVGTPGAYDKPALGLYADGLTIYADGLITGFTPIAETLPAKRQVDRAVAKYLAGFAAAVEAGQIETPGPGDCLMCQLELQRLLGQAPTIQTGHLTPAGHTDTTGTKDPFGADHLLSHFDEGYFVPSLLGCAFVARHYGGGPAIGWSMAVTRKDGAWARRDLGRYLRQYKPALVAELRRGA